MPAFYVLEKKSAQLSDNEDTPLFTITKVEVGSANGVETNTDETELCRPERAALMLVTIEWDGHSNYYGRRMIDCLVTDGTTFTFTRRSLPAPRIPLTKKVVAAVNAAIEDFWRKLKK